MKQLTMKEREEREIFQHEFAMDILKAMPENKKEILRHALERNAILTSEYGLYSMQMITCYKEGWYIELYGTRCAFKVWAYDNDGEFVFARKPKEEKLSKLYAHCFFGLYELNAAEAIA